MEKNKISIRQIFIIFIISTLSPGIRLFPNLSVKLGHRACWVAPILSAIVLYCICIIMNIFFKNKSVSNLSNIFELTLGKIIGKALALLFLFWCIILYFLYIRYYAERLLSSIFPNTDIRFFLLVMMLVVFMAVRGKIETYARFCEIAFLLFTFVMIVFFIFLLPNVKINNLLPLTHLDIIPAAKATYPILGIWGYITLMFIFGEYISDKDQIKKQSNKTTIFITIMTMLLIAIVVGVLGYSVTQRMPLPFFNATKTITLMETFDRFESVLLSIWVISDFIIISLFALLIKNILKNLFAITEPKYLASPIALIGYVGSLAITINSFELELFSKNIVLLINIILCFIIPIIIYLIGKLRKIF